MTDSSTRIRSILGQFDEIDQETLGLMIQLSQDQDENAEATTESMLEDAKNQVVAYVSEIRELTENEMSLMEGLKQWFKTLNTNHEFLSDEKKANEITEVNKDKVYSQFEKMFAVASERSERMQTLHQDISDMWSKQLVRVRRALMAKEEEVRQLTETITNMNNAKARRLNQKVKQAEHVKLVENERFQLQTAQHLRVIEEQKGTIDKLKAQLNSMRGEIAYVQSQGQSSSQHLNVTLLEKENELNETKLENETKIAMLNQRIAQLEKEMGKVRDTLCDERDKSELLMRRVAQKDSQIQEMEGTIQKYARLLELERSKPARIVQGEMRSLPDEEVKMEYNEEILQIATLKEKLAEQEERHKREMLKQADAMREKFAAEKQKLIGSLTSDNSQQDMLESIVKEYEKKLATARTEYDELNESLLRRMGSKISVLTRQYENRIKALTASNEVLILQKKEEVQFETQKARIEIEEEFNKKIVDLNHNVNEKLSKLQAENEKLEEENHRMAEELADFHKIMADANETLAKQEEEQPEAQSKSDKHSKESFVAVLEIAEKYAHRMKSLKDELCEQKDWELAQQKAFYETELERQVEEHQAEMRTVLLKVQDAVSRFQTEGETTVTISEAIAKVSDAYEHLNEHLALTKELKGETVMVSLEEANTRMRSLTEKILNLESQNTELMKSMVDGDQVEVLRKEKEYLQRKLDIMQAAASGDASESQKLIDALNEEHQMELSVKDAIIMELKLNGRIDFIGTFDYSQIYAKEPATVPPPHEVSDSNPIPRASLEAQMTWPLLDIAQEIIEEYETYDEFEDVKAEEPPAVISRSLPQEEEKREPVKQKVKIKTIIKEVPRVEYVQITRPKPRFTISAPLSMDKRFIRKFVIQKCQGLTLQAKSEEGKTETEIVEVEPEKVELPEVVEEAMQISIPEEAPVVAPEPREIPVTYIPAMIPKTLVISNNGTMFELKSQVSKKLFISKVYGVDKPMNFSFEEVPTRIIKKSPDDKMAFEVSEIVTVGPTPPRTIVITADSDIKARIDELNRNLHLIAQGKQSEVRKQLMAEIPLKVIDFREQSIALRDIRIQTLQGQIEETERQQKLLRDKKMKEMMERNKALSSIPRPVPKAYTPAVTPMTTPRTEPVLEPSVKPEVQVQLSEEVAIIQPEKSHPVLEFLTDDEPVESDDPFTESIHLMRSNMRFISLFMENENRISDAITGDINAYESFLKATKIFTGNHKSIVDEIQQNARIFTDNIQQMNSFQMKQHRVLKLVQAMKQEHLADQRALIQMENEQVTEKLESQQKILKELELKRESTGSRHVDQLLLVQKMENSLDVIGKMQIMTENDVPKHQALLSKVRQFRTDLKSSHTVNNHEFDKTLVALQDFIAGLIPTVEKTIHDRITRRSASELRSIEKKTKSLESENLKIRKECSLEKERNEQLKNKIRALEERLGNQKELNESTISIYNAQISNLKSLLEQLSSAPEDQALPDDLVSAIRSHVLSMQSLLETSTKERDLYKVKCYEAEDRLAALEQEKFGLANELSETRLEIERLNNQNIKNAEKQLFHESDMKKLKLERAIASEASEKQRMETEEIMAENVYLTEKLNEKDAKIQKLKNELTTAQFEIDDLQIRLDCGRYNRRIVNKAHVATQTMFRSIKKKPPPEQPKPEAQPDARVEEAPPGTVLPTVELAEEAKPDTQPEQTALPVSAHGEEEDTFRPLNENDQEAETEEEETVVPLPIVRKTSQDISRLTLGANDSSSLFASQVQWEDEEIDYDKFDEHLLPTERRYNDIDVDLLAEKAVNDVHQPLNWGKKKKLISPITPKRGMRPKTSLHAKLSTISQTGENSDLAIGDVTPGKRAVGGQGKRLRPIQPARGPRREGASTFEPIESAVRFQPIPATQPVSPARSQHHISFGTELPLPSPFMYESLRITRVDYEEEQATPVKGVLVHPTPTPSRSAARSPTKSPAGGAGKMGDVHKIVTRMREQIQKLQKQNEKKDKMIVELKKKITVMTRESQRLKMQNIKAEETAKVARLRYDNLQLRFEIIFKELSIKSEQLSEARREIIQLKNISGPAIAKFNRMQKAREEQIRIMREKQKQKEVLDAAKDALTKTSNEATQKHIKSLLDNTQRTMIRLEAKREMWKEVEKKQMMAALGALSLIDEKPVFDFKERSLPSPFRKNRLQIIGATTRAPSGNEFHVIESFPEHELGATKLPSYAKSIQIIDKVTPPLSPDEKRRVIHGLAEGGIMEKLKQVEVEEKKSDDLSNATVSGHNK